MADEKKKTFVELLEEKLAEEKDKVYPSGRQLGMKVTFEIEAELMYCEEAKSGSMTLWIGHGDVTEETHPARSVSVGIGCDTWVHYKNQDAWRIDPKAIIVKLTDALYELGLLAVVEDSPLFMRFGF